MKMRFKAQIQNITTFNKFVASLASLGPVAWVRLSEQEVRFTIIPEKGTQVWAVLLIETIFDQYTIQSAAANVINLEVPLAPLQRALRSALNATSASIRLTKKDNIPLLSLTILTNGPGSTLGGYGALGGTMNPPSTAQQLEREASIELTSHRDRETVITQDVPVRVLSPESVEGLHEPRCRDPDVHIILPPLMQIKGISDRFTKLALTARDRATGGGGSGIASSSGPRLELSANMHGCLRLGIKTDSMKIQSTWTGLQNPELDPAQIEGGAEGVANHPSTRMKGLGDRDGNSEAGWATVRIDGRDWGRVMSVGRLDGRVIGCFCHEHALILYVYLPSAEDGGDESVLTYYVSSYST